MNTIDQNYKNKIIESCAKEWILGNRKIHIETSLLKKYINNEIIPSIRQLREWRISSKIKIE